MYQRYIKRAADCLLSFIGLIILSPVFLLTSIAIKIFDPGPVLFKQPRVGKNKESFTVYKFRSMRVDTPQIATPDFENSEQYISKLGSFIRKTSIDELPQLWNIFKGDMSIIGPRPATWDQDDLMAERDKYGVHALTPGLTGWAQINGRDAIAVPDKAKFDGEYVEKISFLFDVKIFFKTILVVFAKKDIIEGKHAYVTPDVGVVEYEKEL